MKLTDRSKKRLTIAGLGVVCVALIIIISSQYKEDKPEEVILQPSPAASNTEPIYNTPTPEPTVEPTKEPEKEPTKEPEISPKTIESTPTPTQAVDTGKSAGTEQSIQAEVKKPTEPPKETKTDPAKTPDGKKVDAVTPTEHEKVEKPKENSSSSPKSGEKKDGKIYVPGFGWIEDNGGGVQQNEVGSDGDIDKQVGNMD